MHPAENRGYRELYLTGRQLVGALDAARATRSATPDGGAGADEGAPTRSTRMLAELAPLTARHDLHGRRRRAGHAARGSAPPAAASAIASWSATRRCASRSTTSSTSPTLLAYLAKVSETRGDAELPEFCRSWERRLRRQLGAVRKAAVAMGEDPDAAIEPLDPSPVGRAAHGAAYAAGTVGEWVDRQVARRRPAGAGESDRQPRSGRPSSGVDASAWSLRAMRPARRAS